MRKCPSCGVEFENHLGLIGTCGKLQKAIRFLKKISARVQDDNPELAEDIDNQIEYLETGNLNRGLRDFKGIIYE